jgi:hypothetical protein
MPYGLWTIYARGMSKLIKLSTSRRSQGIDERESRPDGHS